MTSRPRSDATATASQAPPEAPVASHVPFISPDRPAYKWWVAAAVMWNAFLVIMNHASMNLALPPMMTAFGLNLDQVQWVVTAYMIAAAVLVPTIGWLGNLLGNRNLFMLGLIVFIASELVASFANWPNSL